MSGIIRKRLCGGWAGLCLWVACCGCAVQVHQAQKPDAAARLQRIAQERGRIQQSKAGLVEALRQGQSELNSVRAELEREDVECQRLRQELLAMEAQAENVRRQLDRRMEALPRYSQKTAECRHIMERLNAFREQEQDLDIEEEELRNAQGKKQ